VFSALTDITDQIDPKFVISYWIPALVATFGGGLVWSILTNFAFWDLWANSLDGVEQIVLAGSMVGLPTVLAFFFKAVRRPVLMLFMGTFLPRPVAEWGIRRETRAKDNAYQMILASDEQDPYFFINKAHQTLERRFPQSSARVMPTRFGNVTANLEEYTLSMHGIDHWLWWPRLAPLLPDAMAEITSTEVANTTGLLNLSFVGAALGLGGAALLGLAGGLWTAALKILVVGLVPAWLCYRMAVAQGAEAGRHLHAAFDLYRHEILKQLELDIPGNREVETALWENLSRQMMDLSFRAPITIAAASTPADIAQTGTAPGQETSGASRQPTSGTTTNT
jgi:hypothetical protein